MQQLILLFASIHSSASIVSTKFSTPKHTNHLPAVTELGGSFERTLQKAKSFCVGDGRFDGMLHPHRDHFYFIYSPRIILLSVRWMFTRFLACQIQ